MYDLFEKLKFLSAKPTVTGPVEFLVVGLGNPERQIYETTRHNAGFLAVDRMRRRRWAVKIEPQLKFKSRCAACAMLAGRRVLLSQAAPPS